MMNSHLSALLLTALTIVMIPSSGVTDTADFTWLSPEQLSGNEQISAVEFTYSHRDEVKHDCSHGTTCESHFIAVEEKTALCRFRTGDSMLFKPGLFKPSLLKHLMCDPLWEANDNSLAFATPTPSTEPEGNTNFEVQVLALSNLEQYLQISLPDENVKPWAVLPDEQMQNRNITFCFFQESIHQKTVLKIGYTFSPWQKVPAYCRKLSTDLDLNQKTINTSTVRHYLSAESRIIPLQSQPCEYEKLSSDSASGCLIHKCWPYWKPRSFNGQDDCTGQCRAERCLYIKTPGNSPGNYRRCCQGSSGCHETCIAVNSPVIIAAVLGSGIPLLCVIGALLACWNAECIGDSCTTCRHGIAELFRTIGRGINALLGYCTQYPNYCVNALSNAAIGSDHLAGQSAPQIQVDDASLDSAAQTTTATLSEEAPPSYKEACDM